MIDEGRIQGYVNGLPLGTEAVYVNNTNFGNIVYLPQSSLLTKGRKYKIRNVGTQLLEVRTQNSYTLDNVASRTVQYLSPSLEGEYFEVVADTDNSTWWAKFYRNPALARTSGSYTSAKTISSASGDIPLDTDIVIGSSTGGNFTLTLPASGNRRNGQKYTFRTSRSRAW